MNGKLAHGEVLPKRGIGYRIMPQTTQRKARFGVIELVMLIKSVAHKVFQKNKGVPLQVADLSVRRGGKIKHHGSHQNGRDVDLLFYMLTKKGKPAKPTEFVSFDKNGFSINPPMKYRFDVKRNWALVNELLSSKRATVQWIFIADYLKKRLLEYAEETGASKLVRAKAESVLHQPGKKLHWDHFHVRIYCPAKDKPECRDVGPRWAWVH